MCSLSEKVFQARDLELPIFVGSFASCWLHSMGYRGTSVHPYLPVANQDVTTPKTPLWPKKLVKENVSVRNPATKAHWALACSIHGTRPPDWQNLSLTLSGWTERPQLRWAKSRDSYRRIASATYRRDSNHWHALVVISPSKTQKVVFIDPASVVPRFESRD